MSYDQKFIIALGFSLVSEIIVLLVLNRIWKLHKKSADVIFAGFLATFSSIAYLWYVLPNYWHGMTYLILGEMLVVTYETAVLKKIMQLSWTTAMLLSIVANVVSFGLGRVML